jgi:CheY-like chemotaxis protein
VDNQAWVRAVLDLSLSKRGFDVWEAADGLEAIATYQRHHESIDLVLLNAWIPGLDGPQTLAALQELNPAVCCCFMRGHTSSQSAEELLRLGAAYVFTKPFCLATVTLFLRLLVLRDSIQDPYFSRN